MGICITYCSSLRTPLSFALFSPKKTAGGGALRLCFHISSVRFLCRPSSPQFFGVAGVSQRGARPEALRLVDRRFSFQRRCRAKPVLPKKAYGLQWSAVPTGSNGRRGLRAPMISNGRQCLRAPMVGSAYGLQWSARPTGSNGRQGLRAPMI